MLDIEVIEFDEELAFKNIMENYGVLKDGETNQPMKGEDDEPTSDKG